MFWKKDIEETLLFLAYMRAGYPFIVFDLETSGLKVATDRIVQFSANKYEKIEGKYQMTDSIDLYIKPPFLMEQSVIDVHGITNEFLENKPSEAEAFQDILKFMNVPAVFTGYNIKKFDMKFIAELFKRQGYNFEPNAVVDIYTIAKELIYPKETENSLKLINVCNYFGIADGVTFHSAAEDILATWNCGLALAEKYQQEHRKKEEEKEKAIIKSMSQYKKSSSVNRIYVDILCSTGYGKVYYDIPKKGWVDCGDNGVIPYINMHDLNERAENIAKSRNFKSLEKFEGSYKAGKEDNLCMNT